MPDSGQNRNRQFVDNGLPENKRQRKSEQPPREPASVDAKERLQSILNAVDDGIALVGLDGSVLDCNEASLKLLGLTREEFIGTNVYDSIVPEDKQRAIDGALKVLQTGRVLNQVGVMKKNGSSFCAEISVTALYDKERKPVSFIGVTRDITERKKMEEELKESEQLYRTLFDNSEEGFMLLELIYDENDSACDFRFLKINPAYERQTGAKADDVLGKRAKEVTPELEPSVIDLSSRVVRTQKPIRCEAYNKYSNKWYDSYYFPFSKSRVGILFRDISERKKAEEALLESEEKYKQLVDRLPEMIFEIDQKGRVAFANLRAVELLGYSKEELESNFDANRFVAPEDVERSKENMKLMFTGGMRQSNEYVFIKKDGSRFPVLLTSAPVLKDNKVVGARGTVVNMTERKDMERQLQDKERLAAIGTTAGMVGHDIRNPLQAMVGEVYMLKSDLEKMPESELKESVKESFDSLESNIFYINKIVADLQDYARPLNPEYKEVKLPDLLISIFDAINVPDSIKLSFDIKTCPNIRTDPEFIRRALTNLVTNAIQAMPKGGTLELTAFEIEDKAYITVSDTGIGIPEEVKHKLFTPMTTTKAKGQGLGLAVVKRLVEALNGSITFESAEGQGTKFTISLPK